MALFTGIITPLRQSVNSNRLTILLCLKSSHKEKMIARSLKKQKSASIRFTMFAAKNASKMTTSDVFFSLSRMRSNPYRVLATPNLSLVV
jgi:hypothetical protein